MIFGIAVFYVTNQKPANLDELVSDWEAKFNAFYDATEAADVRAAAGAARGTPPVLVKRLTTCQDHGDGGTRALDVRSMVRSLRLTWLRRLCDGTCTPWKDLVLGGVAGALPLRQGDRIFASTATFRNLPTFS